MIFANTDSITQAPQSYDTPFDISLLDGLVLPDSEIHAFLGSGVSRQLSDEPPVGEPGLPEDQAVSCTSNAFLHLQEILSIHGAPIGEIGRDDLAATLLIILEIDSRSTFSGVDGPYGAAATLQYLQGLPELLCQQTIDSQAITMLIPLEDSAPTMGALHFNPAHPLIPYRQMLSQLLVAVEGAHANLEKEMIEYAKEYVDAGSGTDAARTISRRMEKQVRNIKKAGSILGLFQGWTSTWDFEAFNKVEKFVGVIGGFEELLCGT